jgi:hypothetical protein
MRTLLAALLVLLLMSGIAAAQSGRPSTAPEAEYDLSWWTVDDGGGTLSDGSYSLSGTIGQAEAGAALAEGTYTLIGGYWYGAGEEVERYELYLPSVIR